MMMMNKTFSASVGSARSPAPVLLRAVATPGRPSFRTAAVEQQHVDQIHRTERLLGLTDEFTHHWISGVKEGPTPEVLRAIATVSDNMIVVKSIQPLGKLEFQGIDGLRDVLTLSQHREGGLRPVKTCLCAANDEDDSVFCLMESEADLRYPLLAEEKEKGADAQTLQHRAYGLVKFDTLLDDTSRCVTGLVERWQLSPSDMRLMAVHMPAVAGTEGQDKEAKFKAAMAQCGAAHFPKDRIKETKGTSFDAAAARCSMEKWCQARCSGQDENALLSDAFVKKDFLLWDAMGVLPMVCGIKPGFEHSTSPTDCVLGFDQVQDLIRNTKATNEITCCLLDKAVSTTHNVGFTHWRSHVYPKAAKGEQAANSFILEGLELHVFDEEGKILDIWMLRDPMQAEQDMLSGIATAAASAKA